MSRLFEIIWQIEDLLTQAAEEAELNGTGELHEDLVDQIEALEFEKERKIEAWVGWIVSEKRTIEAKKEYVTALKMQIDRMERAVENSKNLLLHYTQGVPFKFPAFSISRRVDKRTVIDDLDRVPDRFKTYKVSAKIDNREVFQRLNDYATEHGAPLETVVSASLNDIKKAIAEGIEVEGAHIEDSVSMQIREAK